MEPRVDKSVYEAQGFYVIEGFVAEDLCDTVVREFQRSVKPYRSNGEEDSLRIRLDQNGNLKGSLDISATANIPELEAFRNASLRIVDYALAEAQELIGIDQATSVGYFEVSPSFNPHRESARQRVFVWVALEDIREGSGELYLFPGTHKGDCRNAIGDKLNAELRDGGYEIFVPELKKGYGVVVNSSTAHGSKKVLDLEPEPITRHSMIPFFLH